jgi:hypothetical protein
MSLCAGDQRFGVVSAILISAIDAFYEFISAWEKLPNLSFSFDWTRARPAS